MRQALVVKKALLGRFAMIAGQKVTICLVTTRRGRDSIAKHWRSCRVVVQEADLTEIILAENVQREPMHPANEFEARRELIEKGNPWLTWRRASV